MISRQARDDTCETEGSNQKTPLYSGAHIYYLLLTNLLPTTYKLTTYYFCSARVYFTSN